MTNRPANICVSYLCVKVARTFISSCGIKMILFSWYLYHMVRVDGMVGVGVFSVHNLGYGAVILRATLGGTVSPAIFSGGVYTTLVCAPGLFRRAQNSFEICIRDDNWVSPMCENIAS